MFVVSPGSFLIKAFDLIYKKYEEFGSSGGQYVKLQILNENLYGVDLDEQAIEIARLNLLVASLEKREKLPNLMNIKNARRVTSNGRHSPKRYCFSVMLCTLCNSGVWLLAMALKSHSVLMG